MTRNVGRLLSGLLLAVSAQAVGQTCTSGDCQPGSIGGPLTTSQVVENTAANFPICGTANCTTGTWNQQIEGIDAQQDIGTATQFYDSGITKIDANIAVGATLPGQHGQVLEWVNPQYVQAFDKVTGAPVFSFATGAADGVPHSVFPLWSATTQPECIGNSTNVQVLFDRMDEQFVISRFVQYASGGVNHYAWCIAVSSSSDLSQASTQWYAYEYKMDNVIPCVPTSNNCTTGTVYYYFPDWPRAATWSNGFYISFDLEDPSKNFAESGFEACQLDRANMVKGAAPNPMTCYTYSIPAADRPSLIHSVDVADIDSASGPPAGEPEYFLAEVTPSNAQGLAPCTSVVVPCQSNQVALFTWGASNGLTGPAFVTVNPYTPGCYDTSGTGTTANTACVPEPSTPVHDVGAYGSPTCGDFKGTPCPDSLGDRLANRLTYNNLAAGGSGPNGGYLTASHVVMENSGNQSTGIRYYILKVSGGAATVVVNSGGSSGPPDLYDPSDSLYFYMPSAALDQNGNLGLTYTTSSLGSDPALYFNVLPWGAGGVGVPQLIVQGTGDEENAIYWGEYASTVLDSTDNLTFYGVGEYFNTSQTGTTNCSVPSSNCYTWQTKIFRDKFSSPSHTPGCSRSTPAPRPGRFACAGCVAQWNCRFVETP
jgi:hypothetical protein